MSTKKKIPARRVEQEARRQRNKADRARHFQPYTDPDGYEERLEQERIEKAKRMERSRKEARERQK